MVKCLQTLVLILVLAHIAPTFSDQTLSDPTTPLGYREKALLAQSFTLNSIFKSAAETKAIVNGKLVKVGDSVNGGKVVAISDRAVAIETKDGVQQLVLHRQVKKNSATQ